jgi:ethanolamine utilization protein EutL
MAIEVQHTLKPEPLAMRLIPNVHAGVAEAFGLKPHEKSIAMITATIDDPLYIGGDEATKKADVRVAFCHSHYAGGNYPSGPLSGEALLVLAAPNPAEATAGLNAVCELLDTLRYSTVELTQPKGLLAWLAYTIARPGTYLAEAANAGPGMAIAYLAAPPLEGVYAVERALKAADVAVGAFTKPPSETNYMGALLIGSQSACRAACKAFDEAVFAVATSPTAFQ